MEILDIILKIPAIIPPIILMMVVFLMMQVLECLWLMEYANIGLLRPYTFPLAIVEFNMVLIEVVTIIDGNYSFSITMK